jgi:hypothetical protein
MPEVRLYTVLFRVEISYLFEIAQKGKIKLNCFQFQIKLTQCAEA